MTNSTDEATSEFGLNQAEKAQTLPNDNGTAMAHDMTADGINVHIPRREEADKERKPGAAFDIDAGDMPQEGFAAVDDSDDTLLDEEKRHKISDIPDAS